MEFPLPDELTELVFNHLDAPSLLRCMQVCKLFHSVISGSIQFVYKTELFASCMVDNEHSSMDAMSRLSALREHNRVWKDLIWPSHGSIPLYDGYCWEFSGGILAQSSMQNEVFLVQLPCKPKGIVERRWSIPFGFTIRDFTFDNSQDLIALLELTGVFPNAAFVLHLRTLSGGRHPQTTVAQITHAPGNLRIGFGLSFAIQICGTHLAVLFHDGFDGQTSSLLVWNWKTGQKEMHVEGPEYQSFAFMTEDLILAAVLRSDMKPTLRVLRIAAHTNSVYSFKDAPYICELHYPGIQGDLDSFLISSAELSPASRPPTDSGVPFYSSREDFVFTIAMRTRLNGARENIVHFVLLSTLLSEVERSRGMPCHDVAWDTWGPNRTRMIGGKLSSIWVCYTHGMKFIQVQRGHRNLAQIYDFNPYATRMDTKPSVNSPSSWNPLAKQSKPSPRCKGFDREVTTTLPGRVAYVTLHNSEQSWEAVMIGENHILMVQPRSSMFGYMAM